MGSSYSEIFRNKKIGLTPCSVSQCRFDLFVVLVNFGFSKIKFSDSTNC